jgi:hypothetical protein
LEGGWRCQRVVLMVDGGYFGDGNPLEVVMVEVCFVRGRMRGRVWKGYMGVDKL